MLEVQLKEEDRILTSSQLSPKEGIQLQCISNNFQNNVDPKRMFEEIVSKIYTPQDTEKSKINMEKDDLLAVVSEEDDDESDRENLEDTDTKKKKGKKKPVCPKYKIVEGSMFAVDAFRFGEITGVEHYFLTHFHSDHYIGLRKKFSHKIYLSEITAKLVRLLIGVSAEYLNVVHVNYPFYVDGVRITPIDANHCPGALLFLFQFPDGRNVLHTGDFRANDRMVEQLLHFKCQQLDLLYLDTTYLHTKKRMPPQDESIKFVIDGVQKYLESNIGEKFLILVGAYLIGKERVWMSIAEHFNFRVFLDKDRLKAFMEICTCSIEFYQFFRNHITFEESEADVRVVSMLQISYPNLRDFLSENQDSYNTILGVVATGWGTQKYSSGRISILHCQYSEHSSYDELERFVLNTRPKNVISTVPVRMNTEITADIPKNWLTHESSKSKKKQRKLVPAKKS
jgi:DNA cross-link repair 1A protein